MAQIKLPETAPELIKLARKIEGGPNASFTMPLPRTPAEETDRLVAFAVHRANNPNRQTTALEIYALAAAVADKARDAESAAEARRGAQRLLQNADVTQGVYAWKMNVEGNHFIRDSRPAETGEQTVTYPGVIDEAHVKLSGAPGRPGSVSGISQYTRESLTAKLARLTA